MPISQDTSGADDTRLAARLERWLVSDDVVLTEPPHVSGGIINYREADGMWDGVYPEICGYYLQFLAHASAGSPSAPHREIAARVIRWLDAEGGEGAPLTLYRRIEDLSAVDWRNRCLFSFDLAIILRGLGMAEARWPGILPARMMARYGNSVARIVERGRLASHVLRDGRRDVPIPVKWSTTRDVHHVKSAAALAGLGQPRLDAIAQETARDEGVLLDQQQRRRMRELHPFLYSIEGWLTFWAQTDDAQCLQRAATSFAYLCAEFDRDTADLPPSAGTREAAARADVLAQALRAGVILKAAAALDAATLETWRAMAPRLHRNLAGRLSPQGGVEFDKVRRDRNSWASMFAWQAFSVWDQARARSLDARAAAGSLI
ncbi:hypothetical protein [Belnapia sp. F-4-1]|uniref:hypothetical protein n=1 Tax=Belnapia sp. F-4-1 TaxID=1545443 RepID=UPI00118583DC|nr:hypothetical protein [Belnapia sp. F-4-1]